MLSEETNKKITEKWDSYMQSQGVVLDAERDSKRLAAIVEIKAMLDDFSDGETTLSEFKTKLDGYNKRNNLWGFMARQGQMFFNLLTKASENQLPDFVSLLKEATAQPVDLDDALSKIEKFEAYVSNIAAAAANRNKVPKAGSIGYFLSYFWQIHDHVKWPVMYASLTKAFAELGLWEDGDSQREAYGSFFKLNEEIKSVLESHTGSPVSNWEAEHIFYSRDTPTPPRTSTDDGDEDTNEPEGQVLTHWPSGTRDVTEMPSFDVELTEVTPEVDLHSSKRHFEGFLELDGVDTNDYGKQNELSGLIDLTPQRLRSYRKLYERLGLTYREDDALHLSDIAMDLKGFASKLTDHLKQAASEETERFVQVLRTNAISVLSRDQLDNPTESQRNRLPQGCDVFPFRCIWQAMMELDRKLHFEEVNRVLLRVMKMADLPNAIGSIRDARVQGLPYTSLGDPVFTDQVSARISPWFSMAGWGGLIIERENREAGFRHLVPAAVPLLREVLSNPPTFFHAQTEEEWFEHYLQGAVPIEEEDVDAKTILKAFRTDLVAAGLHFDDEMIVRFFASLQTKPFLILTGLSGSGKTKLAQAFARWLSPKQGQRYELVAVGPDWSTKDNVLGYADAIDTTRYARTQALNLILKAEKSSADPYFVIFDEMNLSHVERYFADILSAMESGEAVLLHGDGDIRDGVPASLQRLPSNLFIVGTVNVDDTTYMFSPKVLDRANVIEFRVNRNGMDVFLSDSVEVDLTKLNSLGAKYGRSFLKASASTPELTPEELLIANGEVLLFFTILEKFNAEFGFRTAVELRRFIAFHKAVSEDGWRIGNAIDAQVFQKILPKLHGSRRKLEPVLTALAMACHAKRQWQDGTEGLTFEGTVSSRDSSGRLAGRVSESVSDKSGWSIDSHRCQRFLSAELFEITKNAQKLRRWIYKLRGGLNRLNQAYLEFRDANNRVVTRVLIVSEKARSLKEITKAEANEYGEELLQLVENSNYEYQVQSDDLLLRESDVVIRSKIKSGDSDVGRISTQSYTGLLELSLVKKSDQADIVAKASVEVRSRKLNYRQDYRFMLDAISSRCTELLLDLRSPTMARLKPDPHQNQKSLPQRFGFIRSLLNSPEFQNSVARVLHMPYRRSEPELIERSVSRGFKPGSSVSRQFGSAQPRRPLPDNHPLHDVLRRVSPIASNLSIPAKIWIEKQSETVDNPENRFIKYTLRSYSDFLLTLIGVLKRQNVGSRNARVIVEASHLADRITSILAHELFKGVSSLTTLTLSSPALQKRPGYRELVQIWIKFNLASNLTWEGGEDIYGAGKRDMDRLYEYWLYFELLDVVTDVFRLPKPGVHDLMEVGQDSISLKLKAGKALVIDKVTTINNRRLRVEFSYNRTFPHSGARSQAGSWTLSMRPDFTLSVYPDELTRERAEELELMVHLHFDAKYRADKLTEVFADETLENFSVETPSTGHTMKSPDLLKMHSYRDAIKRSEGAYVLYPGFDNKTWRGFQEILPGLGAFAMRPESGGRSKGAGSIAQFIKDAVDHLCDRSTVRERNSFHRYELYRGPARRFSVPTMNLSGFERDNSTDRDAPPIEQSVIVALESSSATFANVISNQKYHCAVESEGVITSRLIGANYVLLGTGGDTAKLFRIKADAPELLISDDRSPAAANLSFDVEPSHTSYCWSLSEILRIAQPMYANLAVTDLDHLIVTARSFT